MRNWLALAVCGSAVVAVMVVQAMGPDRGSGSDGNATSIDLLPTALVLLVLCSLVARSGLVGDRRRDATCLDEVPLTRNPHDLRIGPNGAASGSEVSKPQPG